MLETKINLLIKTKQLSYIKIQKIPTHVQLKIKIYN